MNRLGGGGGATRAAGIAGEVGFRFLWAVKEFHFAGQRGAAGKKCITGKGGGCSGVGLSLQGLHSETEC